MNKDPYELLGVDRKASQQEIRKAYRKLAKELHPDLRPGDKAAEDRFKDVSRAYDVIGDAEKRKKYDRGEIDETGTDRPEHQFYRQYADAGRGRRYYTFTSDGGGAEDIGDIEDLVSSLFRDRGGAGTQFRMPGADVRLRLLIDFQDAAGGTRKRVTMPDGKSLDLTVPEGTRDGQIMRLKGKGLPGTKGAPAGDALVEVAVRPHPFFERHGDDIVVKLPITIDEAVLGAKVAVPTLSGRVTMTIPKGANSGQTLRLRGKGVRHRGKAGDQLVRLTVMLPEKPDSELEGFLKKWRKAHAYDPRRVMMEKAS